MIVQAFPLGKEIQWEVKSQVKKPSGLPLVTPCTMLSGMTYSYFAHFATWQFQKSWKTNKVEKSYFCKVSMALPVLALLSQVTLPQGN